MARFASLTLRQPTLGMGIKVRRCAREQLRVRCAAATEAPQGDAARRAKVHFELEQHVEWGQKVVLAGGDNELGSWDTAAAIPMRWQEGDRWWAECALPAGSHVEYKYLIVAEGEQELEVLAWQPCNNLELDVPLEAAAQDAPRINVRDSWQGELHELHLGDAPLGPSVPLHGDGLFEEEDAGELVVAASAEPAELSRDEALEDVANLEALSSFAPESVATRWPEAAAKDAADTRSSPDTSGRNGHGSPAPAH